MNGMKRKSKASAVQVTNLTKRRIAAARIQKLTLKVLKRVAPQKKVSIVFLTDAQIKTVNRLFHASNKPTDVLSFENPFFPDELGEVVISIDRAVQYAKQFSVTVDQELIRYVIHGILHLLGEDDQTPKKRRKMMKRQEALVKQLEPIGKILI